MLKNCGLENFSGENRVKDAEKYIESLYEVMVDEWMAVDAKILRAVLMVLRGGVRRWWRKDRDVTGKWSDFIVPFKCIYVRKCDEENLCADLRRRTQAKKSTASLDDIEECGIQYEKLRGLDHCGRAPLSTEKMLVTYTAFRRPSTHKVAVVVTSDRSNASDEKSVNKATAESAGGWQTVGKEKKTTEQKTKAVTGHPGSRLQTWGLVMARCYTALLTWSLLQQPREYSSSNNNRNSRLGALRVLVPPIKLTGNQGKTELPGMRIFYRCC